MSWVLFGLVWVGAGLIACLLIRIFGGFITWPEFFEAAGWGPVSLIVVLLALGLRERV